jgi:hypothetical protein
MPRLIQALRQGRHRSRAEVRRCARLAAGKPFGGIVKLAVEPYSDEIKNTLQNGLHAYNLSRAPAAVWKEIAVVVRDDLGTIHGGVIAYLFGDQLLCGYRME